MTSTEDVERYYLEHPQASGQPMPQTVGLSATVPAAIAYQMGSVNAMTAYLLAIFLGLLGIHRFYLHRKGSAIAMLVLTLCVVGLLVTPIWVLVDLFLIPGIVRQENTKAANQVYGQS